MSEVHRYVVQSRLLGLDSSSTKSGKGTEYAIEVVLSDESLYTMYRSLKEILNFHNKLLRMFKVEAGYFKKSERVIPDCPIKQTIFGIQRSVRDDKSFEKLLNFYIKDIPALPGALVKSEFITDFFSLKSSDLGGDSRTKTKSRDQAVVSENSLISGPVSLKSYITISAYMDKKSKFSFKEGATVQVLQKDPNGWWMVDAQGLIGWAPASFLVPSSDSDQQEEIDENEQLIQQERVGTRYISMSAYQASRDDELSFVKGAVVKVLNKYVDGWWNVRYNGKEGFVPGAMFRKFDKRQATLYVKQIKRKYTTRGTTRIVPTVKPTWLTSEYEPRKIEPAKEKQEAQETEENKKKKSGSSDSGVGGFEAVNSSAKEEGVSDDDELPPMFCKSLGNFEDNGLIIKENDKVKILDDSGNDWWFVEDKRGKKGWAPYSYFQETGSRSSSRGSLDVPSTEFSDDDDDDDESISLNESEDYQEQYIVTESYTKSSVDELDVTQGQLVCLIDNSDEEIWYVNVEGKEGWLPSNVLKIMTDDASGESSPLPSEEFDGPDKNSRRNSSNAKRRSRISKSPSPQPPDMSVKRKSHIGKSPSPQPPELSKKRSPRLDRRPHQDGSESDSQSRNNSKIDSVAKQLEQLEKDAEEAEVLAKEARKKAQLLREKLNLISENL